SPAARLLPRSGAPPPIPGRRGTPARSAPGSPCASPRTPRSARGSRRTASLTPPHHPSTRSTPLPRSEHGRARRPPLRHGRIGIIIEQVSPEHAEGVVPMPEPELLSEPFRRLSPREAQSLIDSGQVVPVDVREDWEYQ